ncbi:FecR family protein [Pollutimonas sp. M17]|uniref:FecR family protein n=1 Tax=Pollutimonas sp. M17 TaxID=2962065 RepID=UPI0021F48348|nr:FecR family protein [Pollutimonas sp. M17]UYO94704.1 FecR family protein [Pollutimonas sp. M17]
MIAYKNMRRTDHTACAPETADLRELAVWWFTRMHSGEATEDDRRGCDAWRKADAEHDRLYRNMEYFWSAAQEVPKDRLRAVLDKGRAQADVNAARRRYIAWGAGAACTAGVVAAVAGLQLQGRSGVNTIRLATRPGEQREVVLPEGSVLNLNTATTAAVRLYADRRTVELLAGEIMFNVEHDIRRPFIIDAGHSQITVTGTSFNVRRDPDRVHVLVEHGSVDVQAGPWWHRHRRHLKPGQSASIDESFEITIAENVNVASMVAWRRGKIVFENTPLSRVVAEMGRYLDYPITLSDTHLADIGINGVFSIDDPSAMLRALPLIAPVRMLKRGNGGVAIVAR